MKLTIDVGNTNIVCGIWKENDLLWNRRFATLKHQTKDWNEFLTREFTTDLQIQSCVIGSVVPEINDVLCEAVQSHFGQVPIHFAKHTDLTSLQIQVEEPQQVGIDRLINAHAATQSFPNTDAICIDMGTATTIDFVDQNQNFKGGVICPGPRTFLESVIQKASLIDHMQLKKPVRVVGQNTQECLQAGLFYGYPAMIEGIVSEIIYQNKIESPQVFLTGGLGPLFLDHFKITLKYDEWHTLRGLNRL